MSDRESRWTSLAQTAVIALFVFLVVGIAWFDRASLQGPILPVHQQSDQQHAATRSDVNQSDKLDWNNWTNDPVAVFTGVLTGFNGLLFVSTVGLWLANRRSAKIAERALTELERAFVFIDGFNVELTTAADADIPGRDFSWLPQQYQQDPGLYVTRFAIQPRWRNGGNTPTDALTIQINWDGPRGRIPPDYVFKDAPRPFFLAPRAVEPGEFIEIPPAQALIDWANNPVGPPPMILIWGRADYRDVFGVTHFIEWCYQLRFARPVRRERMTANFIQWGDYNRSDGFAQAG